MLQKSKQMSKENFFKKNKNCEMEVVKKFHNLKIFFV